MQLGAFSVSLAVKDLAASKAFYEHFGFSEAGGDAIQNWLVMRNGDTTIGLFQGMFDKNMLTFNPGWDSDAECRGSLRAPPRNPTNALRRTVLPGHSMLIVLKLSEDAP